MMTKRWINLVTVVALGLIAASIRLLAARGTYPACGDAGHFVQHGVALANGVPGAMSTYWAQAMIAIAAGAVKLGFDPRYAMQTTTLVSGVLVVLLYVGVVWRLTGSRRWALVGGLILAVNPTMVQYSITGYSEMPYMAFLMAGVWLGLSQAIKPLLKYGLAGALLGAGGYFKGLDAAVAAISYGVYVLWKTCSRKRWNVREAAVAPIVAFFVLMPLCMFTYSQTGNFTPGSKGFANFLVGSDWADSKVIYAANGLRLEERNLQQVLSGMPHRILANSRDTVRIFNNQLLMKGLRMGTIWFGLGLVFVGSLLVKRKTEYARLPTCMLLLQLGLLELVFVHDRLLVPSLPWLVLLVLLAFQVRQPSSAENGSLGRRLGAVLVLYVLATGVYALNSFHSEFVWWRYAYIQACAKALKTHGGSDRDVVMHYGPHLAIEFNKTNPTMTVEVPYGSIEQVEEIAQSKQVRFVVVSDAFRSHWPIAQLFVEGVHAPTNWLLREELVFPEEEWTGWRGHPGERCRIYERLGTAASADGT